MFEVGVPRDVGCRTLLVVYAATHFDSGASYSPSWRGVSAAREGRDRAPRVCAGVCPPPHPALRVVYNTECPRSSRVSRHNIAASVVLAKLTTQLKREIDAARKLATPIYGTVFASRSVAAHAAEATGIPASARRRWKSRAAVAYTSSSAGSEKFDCNRALSRLICRRLDGVTR